ncbi:hypothetical protein FM076_20665 [Streptomyces albus subsp. chlorinus]|uniref:hypothetical protein n=1 Tax=Streptomyces albus TaxID=1888 RepID=UPI00156F1E7E|nr:hypothetical protein [Streptomyces albus]NSC23432.1 hypothetical protein [Streptomyces albus subsp. chlorinus]
MADAEDEAGRPEEPERTGGRGLLEYSDEERERWRALQQEGERRRRRRRIVTWSLVGVVVLGLAGWAAAPSVKDRVIASRACDGAIPEGSMDTLRAATGDADAHLTEYTTETSTGLGRYSCQVKSEKGRVLEVEVYSRRDSIDRELARQFEDDGGHPAAALPGGLPGFEARLAGIVLMPQCPGHGRDAAGHRGQLLVDVLGGGDSASRDLLRTGAAVANKAAEKLGCDAKPLPVPGRDGEPEQVRVAAAAGTSCAALADGPLQGSGWTADLRLPKGRGPMASCAVRPSGKDEYGDPHDPVIRLYGWYGDWSQRMKLHAARMNGADTGRATVRPWLGESNGWAMARCDGQAAGFEIDVWRPSADGTPPGQRTVSRDRLGKEKMRQMLASFAKKESAERGCEGLRLPHAG